MKVGGITRSLALVAAAALVAIQFVPAERSNPPVRSDVAAPDGISETLRAACYDCHSHETRWPWYGRVAPVSWLVARDVRRGRRALNFSDWPSLDFERQELLYREIAKALHEERMPPRGYRLLHPEARLGEERTAALRDWAWSE